MHRKSRINRKQTKQQTNMKSKILTTLGILGLALAAYATGESGWPMPGQVPNNTTNNGCTCNAPTCPGGYGCGCYQYGTTYCWCNCMNGVEQMEMPNLVANPC